MPKRAKTKHQLSLGFEEANSLSQLRVDTEASSLSEVMREALGVYGCLVDEAKKGGAVSIQHSDGTVIRIAFRGLEMVRKAFSSGSRLGDGQPEQVRRDGG